MPTAPRTKKAGDLKKKKDYKEKKTPTSDMGKDYTAGIGRPKSMQNLRMPNYK